MALLWFDGFDSYGTTLGNGVTPSDILGRRYSYTNSPWYCKVHDGRFGGYSLRMTWDATCNFGHQGLSTTNDTLIVGFALKVYQSHRWGPFFKFWDGTTEGVNLRFNNSGEIEVYRGGTYLNRATGHSIGIDTWKYVEFRVKCHNTNGEYELRINEQVVLSDTALNTQAGANPYHNGFGFVALSSSAGPIFDDFYLLDSSGTVNNTFLGNMRVCTLRPDSDGDSSAWTPNSGANYAMVDEVQSDDDSTYVEGATSGDKDLYHYESLPQVTDAIKAVQIVTECRETDAQTFNIQMPVKSGALEDDGSGQVVGSSDYVQRFRLMDVNPITGLPWTIAEVNAAQFGIKLP